MKKLPVLLLTTLVILVLLVTACKPATAPSEKIELKIMHNWSPDGDPKGPPLQAIFDAFIAANPDITLSVEVFADTEIPTKVETAFLAGEEPDLVFHNYPYGGSGEWLPNGITVDVAPYLEQWGLKDSFKEIALAQYTTKEGKVVAFPLEGFTWPIWYNMKILKEAGVSDIPTTIDELIAASEKIRAAGYQPFVVGGSDWTGQAFFNVINSTYMTDQEFGQVYVSGEFSKNANFVKSVELLVKLRDAGVFADNAEGLDFATMNAMFFEGKAAMMNAGSWSFSECPAELLPDVKISGFPLPEGSPHASPIVPSGFYGKGVWITRNGLEKIDAIEKFVKFFYQTENIDSFVEPSGMTSPLKATNVDEAKLHPLFVQSIKWGDTVTFVDVVDPYIPSKAWEDLTKITKESYIPGTAVDNLLSDLDAAWLQYK